MVLVKRRLVLFTLLLLTSACAGGDGESRSEESADDAPGGMVSGDRSGIAMAGVPMDGPAMDLGGPMMNRMLEHMDSLAQTPADSLPAALPDHRQMLGSMINRMTEEMGRLTMGGSPDWMRLMESVREDWERLPELDEEELTSFLPGHLDRLRGLMDTHRELMAEMHM